MTTGKVLTEPLLILLVLQLGVSLTLLRKQGVSGKILLGSTLILWLLSTPVVSTLLERAISRTDTGEGAPEVIVVAGGGLSRGPDLASQELSFDSRARVIAAAEAHRRFPAAIVVYTGTTGDGLPVDLEARLAMAMLIERGVPPQAIRLEVQSRTTRDHPVNLLKMGMTSQTRVGLVTSGWHMRRAARTFRRHFAVVIEFPARPDRFDARDWRRWLPRSSGLERSTLMIWEIIGTIRYELP